VLVADVIVLALLTAVSAWAIGFQMGRHNVKRHNVVDDKRRRGIYNARYKIDGHEYHAKALVQQTEDLGEYVRVKVVTIDGIPSYCYHKVDHAIGQILPKNCIVWASPDEQDPTEKLLREVLNAPKPGGS
jgi:hypothetical protein